MVSYFINLYSNSKDWLLERHDYMFRVRSDQPEGKIKNRWWIETREWDVPTIQQRIVKHFQNTTKKNRKHS